MAESIEDIIAGYTGKQEPARSTMADRGDYRVVTDPNTELLKAILAELRLMNQQLYEAQRAQAYQRVTDMGMKERINTMLRNPLNASPVDPEWFKRLLGSTT